MQRDYFIPPVLIALFFTGVITGLLFGISHSLRKIADSLEVIASPVE